MLKVFVVGCPRSGTTLIQSMLAAHPALFSTPESHAFNLARERRLYHTPRSPELYEAFRAHLAHRKGADELPPSNLADEIFAPAFIAAMDAIARGAGADGWVEKTPDHLFGIAEIRRTAPDAKFIHILRDPRSTAASLLDAAWRNPDAWGGAKSISWAAQKWNEAMIEHAKWSDTPGHCQITYEALCINPREVVDHVCDFLGITHVRELSSQAGDLILPVEQWKAKNHQAIAFEGLRKYDRIFGTFERGLFRTLLAPDAARYYRRHVQPNLNLRHLTAWLPAIPPAWLEPLAKRATWRARGRFLGASTHEY